MYPRARDIRLQFRRKRPEWWPQGRLRGLEQGDLVWIDKDNPSRLIVFWAGSSPGDYIRVFTERSVGALMM